MHNVMLLGRQLHDIARPMLAAHTAWDDVMPLIVAVRSAAEASPLNDPVMDGPVVHCPGTTMTGPGAGAAGVGVMIV